MGFERGKLRAASVVGFALAPILYIMALAGVAGSVLFTGYTQVLRTNVEITTDNSVRNQIRMAAEVLAAQATINNALQVLSPPAVVAWNTLDAARLPQNAAGTGVADENTIRAGALAVGGVPAQGGVRQLDPWGRLYLACRWESSTGGGQTGSALALLSAGADGRLESTCGSAEPAPGSDDRLEHLTVANVLARAANWQQQAGTYTFGIDPTASRIAVGVDAASVDTTQSLDVGGNARVRGDLRVDGEADLNGDVTAGAINGASLSISGGSAFGGPLTVSGLTTLSDLTAQDVDFTTLDVSGLGQFSGLSVSGASTLAGLNAGATTLTTLNATGAVTLANGLSVAGSTVLADVTAGTTSVSALNASGTISGAALSISGVSTLSSVTATSMNAGGLTLSGALSVGGVSTLTGGFSAGTSTINGDLTVTGTINGGVSGNAGTATTLQNPRSIALSGDADAPSQIFDGSSNLVLATTVDALRGRPISATAPSTNQALVWDGSMWSPASVASGGGGGSGGASVVMGWPDLLFCNVSNPTLGPTIFYLVHAPFSANSLYYYRHIWADGTYQVLFNADGSFNSYENLTATNCNTSIAANYAAGRAFNVVGGGGSSGGGGSGSTILAGWPDSIICRTGASTDRQLTLYSYDGTSVIYAHVGLSGYTITYNQSTGAYSSNANTSAYDCVTNAWSRAQLYANGRAFNFVGGGSGSPAGTAGQVQFNLGGSFAADAQLHWDNANKRLGIGKRWFQATAAVGLM